MNKINILKRLYKDYTRKYLDKIILSSFFSIIVAGSTSAIAWLLDPAIKKIFLEKDQSLLLLIPFLIILAFSAKGISLYIAKILMINVGEEVKKKLQFDMLKSLINADTQFIDETLETLYLDEMIYLVKKSTGLIEKKGKTIKITDDYIMIRVQNKYNINFLKEDYYLFKKIRKKKMKKEFYETLLNSL